MRHARQQLSDAYHTPLSCRETTDPATSLPFPNRTESIHLTSENNFSLQTSRIDKGQESGEGVSLVGQKERRKRGKAQGGGEAAKSDKRNNRRRKRKAQGNQLPKQLWRKEGITATNSSSHHQADDSEKKCLRANSETTQEERNSGTTEEKRERLKASIVIQAGSLPRTSTRIIRPTIPRKQLRAKSGTTQEEGERPLATSTIVATREDHSHKHLLASLGRLQRWKQLREKTGTTKKKRKTLDIHPTQLWRQRRTSAIYFSPRDW